MPDALLSFVRLAGAAGIEPTQAILETASPALEHALLYSPHRAMLWVVPGFSHWPDNLIPPVSLLWVQGDVYITPSKHNKSPK